MSTPEPPVASLDDFRLHAVEIALEAGGIIQSMRHTATTQYKSDGSEVTPADTAAEAFIREQLTQAYPDVPILGEELGGDAKPVPGYQWIIDPIDGTTNFSIGSPVFGTLIALLWNGEPVVGAMHFPAMGETVSAATGSGCWFFRHGETPARVSVSGVKQLQDAFVSTAGLHGTELQPDDGQVTYKLGSLARASRKLRFVGDCYQHALVCRGRIEMAVDAIMQPWDNAALIPCVREAGGYVADIRGGTENLTFAGSLMSTSCPELMHQALHAMRPDHFV